MMTKRKGPGIAAARVIGAAVFTLVTITGLVAPAAAEKPVEWGVRTASNDQGKVRESFSYTVNPGESLDDAVVVTNHGDTAVRLAAYAADGFTTSSGKLDVVTRDTTSTKIGAWVSLEKPRITLEPGESTTVPFTVSVPKNATPGDYAGAVVTSLAVPEVEEGVSVDRRLGIRMQLRVVGDLDPRLVVEKLGAHYDNSLNPVGSGGVTVRYTVHNVGNVRLSAKQAVSVTGPFGWWKATEPVPDAPELLPGETWDVSAKVHGVVPAMAVSATVNVRPLTPDGGAVDSVRASDSTAAVPWAMAAALLLLASAGFGGLRLRRRRLQSRQAAEDARVHEAVDQALRQRVAQATDPSTAA